jgi:glycosyltransferase involved in cell wall biosynthesis
MPASFSNPNATGRLAATYELLEPLDGARADLPLLPRVRLTNRGTVAWPNAGAYPIHLAYHWLRPDGQVAVWEAVRTALPHPLPPGGSAELELHIEPPPGPGRYLLALDLVEEGVGWFSMQGVPWLAVPVEVAPGPANPPRAAIIGALCPPHDAVGNVMLDHLRFFEARSYQARIFVEHLDPRQPRELRRRMLRISHDELRHAPASELTRRAREFFFSADIYVFHFPLPYALFEAITLVERGVVLVDYHGVTPRHLWDGAEHDSFYAAVDRQMGLFRHADYLIAHSGFTRAELLAARVAAPERIYQMGYAVPLERFHPGPKPAYLLERYGLRPEQPVLLYVGRFATNKRIEDLVSALARVRQALPDTALLLVGDDRAPAYAPVAARVRAHAAALGVSAAVIFAGMAPDAELPDHYRLADVFVTASVHEGFCIPVVEAMATGVPVVGADATALPETIGDAGLTFAPGDAAGLAEHVLRILQPQRAQHTPAIEHHSAVASLTSVANS